MSDVEGISVMVGAFVLSLPAMYKVVISDAARERYERAEDICSRTRGSLSTELVEVLRPLVESKTAAVGILDGDGNAMSQASITRPNQLGSEEFQDAVLEFLESESDRFDHYWIAFRCKRLVRSLCQAMRVLCVLWAIFTGLGTVALHGMNNLWWPKAPDDWITIINIFALTPLALFLVTLLIFSFTLNRLDEPKP